VRCPTSESPTVDSASIETLTLAAPHMAALLALLASCSRGEGAAQPVRTANAPPVLDGEQSTNTPEDAPADDTPRDAPRDVSEDHSLDAPREAAVTAVDGPHSRLLAEGRPIYYAFPGGAPDAGSRPDATDAPWRIVANLHGTCGGPTYSCGSWIRAGVEVGALICPTGNAHCGPSPLSPPTWEAPSWGELVRDMESDLERSVAIVSSHTPHAIRRDGAILTGYSRGGYAVPVIAQMRPGRWPLLLVIEADATLDPTSLRRARVRAVALVAGEWGDQIAGMRKTADALAAASFRSRLFVMAKTGHLYSDDIEDVMREALAFLVASEGEADAQ
jgi:hypothetical protein